MKEIELTRGLVALVDDIDYPEMNQYRWFASKQGNATYGKRITARRSGKRSCEYLHRAIMKPKPGFEVDHIDGDGLNNQRSNLRIVSHRENQINRHHPKSSHYPGVSWDKVNNRWRAAISVNGKVKALGNSISEEVAAEKYRKAYVSQVAPVLDAGRCCSCEAMRICSAIVPDGKWNPYGSATVKPCPGVR